MKNRLPPNHGERINSIQRAGKSNTFISHHILQFLLFYQRTNVVVLIHLKSICGLASFWFANSESEITSIAGWFKSSDHL